MELRHLRYFVAVAREGHFGRAAMKLNVAQPAVSRAIHVLEEELGVELFERLPRGVRLAEAGHRYLVEVERILEEISHASRAARSAAAIEQREVVVGQAVMNAGHEDIVDGMLERFCRARPDSTVRLELLNSIDQQRAIRERTIDVAFGYFCGAPLDGIFMKRIYEDPLCGVRLGEGNPLARRSGIELADLSGEPLLMWRRSRNPQVFDYIVQHVHAGGFQGEILQNAEFSHWHWKVMPRNAGWMLRTRHQLMGEFPGTVSRRLAVEIPYGIDFLWGETTPADVVDAFCAGAGNGATSAR